jgi:Leucine-rich repeat (LRR) protein
VSPIYERNEDNLQLSVLQPVDHQERSLVSHRVVNPDTSYSFHLSPLPDFTVSQPDESVNLEVGYVAERTDSKSLRQVHGTFTLAAETLIKHITDVEPFEIYWEHLRQLDLRGNGLITLQKLKEYCPRLEELDVSGNRIGQLGGVPASIRTLNIAGNCLSSLTAWKHLSNLQYVDVSGNELETLNGFSNLVHLRSLKANGNKIRSIDGIAHLDGLLKLELRDNALESIDFERSQL